MDMKSYIDQIIIDLPKENKNFKDFLRYFNSVVEKKICQEKSKLLRNKYIRIKKMGLNYILLHKKEIEQSIKK